MSDDVVYIVRPGDDNDELRHSLRSVAANFPHRRVWIFGHAPAWVSDEVSKVSLVPRPEKWDNQAQSLRAAAEHPEVSDRFWMFNDDYYVMDPMTDPPVFHIGPLDEYVSYLESIGKSPENPWFHGLTLALGRLRELGIDDPLSYEGHQPLPWLKRDLAWVLDNAGVKPLTYASFYPATSGPVGERGMDAKQGAAGDPLAAGHPYLSSADYSWGKSQIGQHVRATFAKPCRFEVAA